MRGIQVGEYVKGPDGLRVTDLPEPVPKPDEYLIDVHVAATNFFDILQVQGKYQHQPPFPWTAGFEFAGTVIRAPTNPAKGSLSPALLPGTRVFGASQGAYATRIVANANSVLPSPKGWSHSEAAGLFVTAPTAYAALVTRAAIKPGDFVLVHAAGGGVGLAAVQVAKALGATVIATAGTDRKLEVARSFGADHVLSYRSPDWADSVKKLTPRGRGVDIVFDPVGLVDTSTRCTAWNGRIVVVGFAGGAIEKVAMNKVLLKNISLVGVFWGAYARSEPQTVPVVWRGIKKLIDAGLYKSTVFSDRRFKGLESVPAALNALGGRETWGKVVVEVKEDDKTESKL